MTKKQYRNIYIATTYLLLFISLILLINSIRFLRPQMRLNTFTIIYGIYNLYNKTVLMSIFNFVTTFFFFITGYLTITKEKSFINMEGKGIKLSKMILILSIIYFILTVSIFSIFSMIIAFLYYFSAKALGKDVKKS